MSKSAEEREEAAKAEMTNALKVVLGMAVSLAMDENQTVDPEGTDGGLRTYLPEGVSLKRTLKEFRVLVNNVNALIDAAAYRLARKEVQGGGWA